MADLTVTAANVVPDAGGSTQSITFGETVTAGQVLYLAAADGRYYKTICNSATAEIRVVSGIALNGGAAGQPGTMLTAGTVTIGATTVVGKIYVASATAGGIAPSTDLVTGWYTAIIGIGITASKILLSIKNGGVAVP